MLQNCDAEHAAASCSVHRKTSRDKQNVQHAMVLKIGLFRLNHRFTNTHIISTRAKGAPLT